MKKYLNLEVIIPIMSMIFLLAYISEALKLSVPMIDGMPQETFFPVIIFVLGFVTSLTLLYTGVKNTNKNYVEPAEADKKTLKDINFKPALVVAATALLIYFFSTLGYLIIAPIYLFILMMIYDDKPQQIIRKLIYTALITAFIYVLYVVIFEIRFPSMWG